MGVNAQTSGNCGSPNAADVQWSYAGGTLTFTGTGAMNMYSENQPQAPWWNDYMTTTTTVVVGEGITTIPHWGFAMFENLTSVTLPSTLTTIGKAALEECAFTTIDLPEGLTTIGDYSFQIGALTSITIPSTVTYIGEVAFQAMESLTSVTFLGSDPTTITFGDNIFQYCNNLTAINVPAGKVDAYKAALPDYAALIVEGGAPTPATSGSCGTNATWSYSNGIMTIGGSGAMTDFSSSMTDIPWIDYQTNITKVVIGDEITHVGDWAFQGCTALNSVTIGEKVTSIGNGSFDNCTNDGFTMLTIPNSVQTIGIDAFSNNHLKYVCFGSGLTSIGMEAFMVCQDLEAIGVSASTPPTLGMEAFMACSNLASIYVPSAKITDYKDANGWSDYAAMIKSPEGECGTDATWSFEMATGVLTIEGTGAIDDFSGWDSTQANDSRAFNPLNTDWYPCGIKNVVIGEGITDIPGNAFYMEVGITDVTLPSTLTAIGLDAFGECENIETITCDATTPPTLADDGNESYVFYGYDAEWNVVPISTITAINVPAASVATYKAAAGWSDYAEKIVAQGGAPAVTTTFTYTATAKVTAFDEYEKFTGATALASHDYADGAGTVVYNGTVTALESGAFYYNDTKEALTAITLPESLTALGDDAFRGCTGLTTVTFDGTPALTTINKRAFKDCSALAAIAIPASVETIGGGAFSDCSELASVTFPGTSALTAIGSTAFSNCESLAAITLPESVTTIGEGKNGSVFSGAGLTSFVLPKNLTTICGGGHFRNCPMTSLTVNADNAKYEDRGSNAIIEKATDKLVLGCIATTVPDGIKVIGNEAFFGEELPFSLTLPESVTTIEARAFHYATGLTAINIPSKVTEIPDETFAQCNFTELVIPDGVTSIGGMAFMMCMSLKTITFGSGLTTIENWAFECPNVTDIYCYATPFTTWNGNGFANAKATKFHVADAKAWGTAFPSANVTFVDDLNAFTLAEDVDNTAAIAGRNGHEANVTLTRTLKAGSYNTFAVPFDIDAATLTAQGITAKKLTASSLDGTTLTLTFADATTIEAGKPYLVKVAADVENPTFAGVTVSSTVSTTETDNVDLVPMMGKTLVTGPEGDKDNTKAVLFLASNNTLVYPTVVNDASQEASYMKGFRAYFQLKGAAADPASVKSFAINFGDETGIISLTPNHSPVSEGSIYMLDGRRVSSQQAQNGVYIVNGKKVIIK